MKIKHLFFTAILFSLSSLPINAATYTVTNTNDSGPVSLREATTTLTPGDLDTTFSDDGKLTDFFGGAYAVAVQPDGKIVAAGTGYGEFDLDFAVARYNADGSRDTTFGSGTGKVATGIFYYGYDEARAIAIQPDGKIIAAGVASTCYEVCALISFALVRYNPDGSLDTSFGGDGIVATLIASSDDRAYSVAIQPDGKVLVAGRSGGAGQIDFTLVRYNTDGSLDATFDSDGIARTSIGTGDDFGSSVAIQPDGKIVVAGDSVSGSSNYFAVVRYNADGSLDTTFDSDGKVATPISSNASAFSVASQSDGKIVAAGYSFNGSNYDFALTRYNPNGSLDTTFDSDGKVTTPIGSGNEHARSVAIQADGKIVATGPYANGSNDDFAVVRYNADGSLDTTFGTGNGKTAVDFGSSNDNTYGIALDRDARAVVVGHSNDRFAIARFLLGPTQPSVFDIAGRVVTSTGFPIRGARVTLENGAGNQRIAFTNPFGHFRFPDVAAGTYNVTVRSKRYGSASRTITVSSSITNLDMVL